MIAAFNAAPYLAASVESALAQEGVAVEAIVADDGSSDDTLARAEAMAAADPRVVALKAERNGGPSAARNRAIAAARGEWIAVLDADDRFAPWRLARLLAFARDREAEIAFDLFSEVDEAGAPVGGSKAPAIATAERWDLRRWAVDNMPGKRGGALGTGYLKPLMKRAFLAEHRLRYRETLRNSEDYLLIAEALAAGASVWCTPEVGYLYTRRSGSISHRIDPDHLKALLAAEDAALAHQFDGFDGATQTIIDRRAAALRDSLACEEMIAALKARRFLSAPAILARRPTAIPHAIAWAKEALSKRIGGR